jgi:AcrR family transcriptional regulator
VRSTVNPQSGQKRRYDSPSRAENAATTRHSILESARELFVLQGYGRTTVAQIAAHASVAVDTIYATVGRKPALMRQLVETSISGRDHAVPARQREYVQRIEAAETAAEKILLYAEAITSIQQRLAPIFVALRDAASTDDECKALWREIGDRRAANMREFAGNLRGTGDLRPDLTDQQVADVIWSMNAAEYWVLLVGERGWTPQEFQGWLVDAWTRLLLAS